LYGQIARLAGADASVYPNWGGRSAFSKAECVSIVEGTAAPMGHLKPIFPAPGGGMTMRRVPEMIEVYGKDVIFLMGGGLHKHGPDLVANCRYFRQLVETI
jgi:ribulose-bisphosphate carboxylase large chain